MDRKPDAGEHSCSEGNSKQDGQRTKWVSAHVAQTEPDKKLKKKEYALHSGIRKMSAFGITCFVPEGSMKSSLLINDFTVLELNLDCRQCIRKIAMRGDNDRPIPLLI